MDAIELRAWALLARCPALTADELRAPLAVAGDAPSLVRAARALLPAAAARQLARADDEVGADLAWLAAGSDRALLPYTHPDYPPLLRATPDAPVALWVEGRVDSLARAQVAVVGTRQPTPTGRELARSWARAFADGGYVVTSGLAAGIDAEAHRGALDSLASGPLTIAARGSRTPTPPRTPRSRHGSQRVARWSASFRRTPARGRPTSHAATASSRDCRSARW